MKLYEVFITDIWNNCYLIGFFKNLDDSIDKINEYIYNDKYKLEKGDLREYASTFGYCFDTNVGDVYMSKLDSDTDSEYSEDFDIFVRGFILDSDKVTDRIKNLEDE